MSKSGKSTVENKHANNPAENIKCSQVNTTSGVTNEKNLASTSKCISNNKKRSPKRMQSTHSDGTLIKTAVIVENNVGLKQKLVNKVKLWNSKEKRVARTKITKESSPNLASDLEGLTLTPDASEDNLFKSDWLKARDSLENLLSTRSEKSEIVNSKSTHFPSSEKPILNESPCSESQIGGNKAMNSVTKVLAWDPWDKLGRKNKKETKRRKREKTPSDNNVTPTSKDHTSGDEIRNGEASNHLAQENPSVQDGEDYLQNYEYQPYHKNSKAVEFINQVMVVYITGDEVVGESTEPLKKELDQQIRNKEMRKGHYPATLFSRRKVDEDYMSAWIKK
ncbi:uncharacterized protein [Onthophagus taurus]|uniref:uncharacterized protein isoform X2 n=1 Tax=Onthophagus taurus TaxID=166361 RepID=UPI0039BE7814